VHFPIQSAGDHTRKNIIVFQQRYRFPPGHQHEIARVSATLGEIAAALEYRQLPVG